MSKNVISAAGYSRQTLKRRAGEIVQKPGTQKDVFPVPVETEKSNVPLDDYFSNKYTDYDDTGNLNSFYCLF